MSNNKRIRTAALSGCSDIVKGIECVHLHALPPFSTLLVRTVNSLYRLVIAQGLDVYVQGGAFFPETTSACLHGTRVDGRCLRVGCVCVGLPLEIRSGGHRIITSRVRAITSLQAPSCVAH
jgi:hypothetical protein